MENQKSPHARNLSIAAIIGLTGFVSLIVIIVALLVGLWIDAQLGWRGPATVCMLAASAPISLFLMVRIALGLSKHLKLGP